jgi:2-polyprenyl-6-methoxyphenol hydroxylase-like FAD-dependent oxidoreductase
MFDQEPEVLVAGAGPVGQFAALALARRGVRVQVVDTGIWACTHSYALALHSQTRELLEKAGVAGRIAGRAEPVRTIALYDGSVRRAEIQLAPGELAVLGQDAIEEAFEAALREAGVKVAWRQEAIAYTPGDRDVTVRLDKYEKESRGYIVAHTEWVVAKSPVVEVPFVVGADGYHSRVRRSLGFDYAEIGPPSYYAVFEFKSDIALNGEMRIVMSNGATDVLWPLPNGYCRWNFELPGPPTTGESDRIKDRMLMPGTSVPVALDEASLRGFISQRAPWFRGSIDGFSFRILARFEKRLSSGYGHGRMWLAGDAAHVTGPIGVQSMNVGLFEADDLAECIKRSLAGTGRGDELKSYQARWMGVWRQLHGLEGGLKAKPGVDPWVAQNASRLLSCLPAHGAELTRLAGQLGLEMAASAQA